MTSDRLINHALFLCCMTLAALPAQAAEELPGYTRQDFSFPAETDTLLLVDADNDGLKDILRVQGSAMHLYFQGQDGFDFAAADATLTLPGEAVGWNLSRNYGPGMMLIALIDGTRVAGWPIENRSFGPEQELLSGLNGFLGKGSNRLNFSRDINDDGLDDLIIPGAGELLLHIRNADGSYQAGIGVLSDMQIATVLNAGDDLERDVGQSLLIPLMQLRDVNGDSRPDLISETGERFDVFLASAGDGQYFPPVPTYSIDRLEIRERLGPFDIDQLDFANLTGVLALTHQEILQDVDGDGIDDFVLREGGKVSLYLGDRNGMSFAQPQQVLRSGGNVLTTFLYDEDGDERPDLWLWRVEPISVGDLFIWLALSGSINVEAFVYRNDGERFASRPARKITVALKFPSAVRVLTSVMDVRDQAREMSAEALPTELANINGIDSNHDLLVLLQDQVQIFLDAIAKEPEPDEDRFLSSIDYSRSRDNYEIDIRRMIDEFEVNLNADLQQVQGREPDHTVSLSRPVRNGAIITSDLNGNEADDIFVFLERDRENIKGILLLSGLR